MLTKIANGQVVADAKRDAKSPVLASVLRLVADATAASGARLVDGHDPEDGGIALGLDGLTLVLPAARPRELGLLDVAARLVRQAWAWSELVCGATNSSGRVRRHNFVSWLGEKVRAAAEQPSNLALLLVRIDDTDPVAGLYGGADVEERVPLVYNAVETVIRGVDSVYRCDDAMLAVVLPRCDRANAIKVTSRLSAALDESVGRNRRTRTLVTRNSIYSYPDELAALALGLKEEDLGGGDSLVEARLFTAFAAGTFRAQAALLKADSAGNLAPVAALGRLPDAVPRTAAESFLAATAAVVPRAGAGDTSALFVPVVDEKGPCGVLWLESAHGSFGPAEVEVAKRIGRHLGPLLRVTLPGPPGVRARPEREFRYKYDGIIGRSPAMQSVFELLERVIPTDYPVIIQGESGTGKELIARAIHYNGRRAEKPLIAENCAALNENLLEAELFGYEKGSFTGAESSRKGLFELADGGTLFLDEVADMKSGMQKDLLRILQEGIVRPVGGKRFLHVDVRIICASNRDLAQLVDEGKFRSDLYYRLNVWNMQMPSLCERREDIALLVEHFLERIAHQTGIPQKRLDRGVMEALTGRDWPGNIRELKNEVARMVALATGDEITLREVSKRPATEPQRLQSDEVLPLEEIERLHILKALRYTNGNRARAAEILGINKATIYRKLKSYGLDG